MSGLGHGGSPTFVTATADSELKAGVNGKPFCGGLSLDVDGYRFTLAKGGHSSGNLINLSRTNGLGRVPLGETLIQAGSTIKAMVLGDV
ncbi:hypothetical protein D0962_33930 [Leptolyngbyaceae cyanobacterium CCMR0082]|uniref:MoeA C-terminal domain-containing protein n=1 Tax=Adonisia turfae CCMR0082 TaxID=2304604 RepID=A0A6M0SH51_9CYAN|nr:hypothetical protein [Adonisia turfae]MDV3347969.1 hypothetical protein [Leptothoe sp. LEGE 181152]NEZ67704.1 hypothetical protein [Adonisia turfae CCMR0082]